LEAEAGGEKGLDGSEESRDGVNGATPSSTTMTGAEKNDNDDVEAIPPASPTTTTLTINSMTANTSTTTVTPLVPKEEEEETTTEVGEKLDTKELEKKEETEMETEEERKKRKEEEREERRERRREKERKREEKEKEKEKSRERSKSKLRSISAPTVVDEKVLAAAGVSVDRLRNISEANGVDGEDGDVPSSQEQETGQEPEPEPEPEIPPILYKDLMKNAHPLITNLVSREKRRINKRGSFTLADFISDAELLQSLLEYLSFYNWCVLASVSRVIRVVMVQKRDVREEILERYLWPVGYRRWIWTGAHEFAEEEPLSLSLQVRIYFYFISLRFNRFFFFLWDNRI
jgi:hypothetical protein